MDPFNAKLVAAATGSTVTALTMTPFDVVKTRLQTQPVRKQKLFPQAPTKAYCAPNNAACARSMSSFARHMAQEQLVCVCVWDHGIMRTERVTGFTDAIRHVVRAEGLRGLWKGAGMTLMIGVPSSTCYMLTYDHLLNKTLPSLLPAPAVPLCAGIIARSSITTLLSPLELVRTNLQSTPVSSSQPHTLRSVLTSISALVQKQGAGMLWRGLGPTLWRDVPFSGLYWASYEGLKRHFAKHNHQGPWVAFACGAISGTTAALFTSPFDVLKTRRQALIMSGSSSRVSSSVPFILQIAKAEGTRALFAGLLPRVAKIAPACGIMIACFEGVGGLLSKK